ncbi:hypothetical protein [Streptomyces albicerus]|uniref:hypothetical protein n=1 Tax=Streptomyces albicerus TaxID=2569859 RepID=UPI00124AFE5B|nr:hypothetical protein [Streptomyces albicerus]
MSDIRAVDLPELRSDLLAHYEHPLVVNWWSERPVRAAMSVEDEMGRPQAGLSPTGNQRRLDEINRLGSAELFFVSSAMTKLAIAAADSLPSFKLASSDVPTLNGFIIFEEPIAEDPNTKGGHGEPVYISGASWSFTDMGLQSPVLWFSFYVDLHRTFEAEVAEGTITEEEAERQKRAQPRFAYTMDAAHFVDSDMHLNEDSVLNLWGRTILTAWLLMRQPLAKLSDLEPDRATRKRLQRANRKPASVRVIELRRPNRSEDPGEGGTPRDYHHQWIVRGHWRQQWYPRLQVHRPVWIAPHVKGPEGAPMIGGEKVNLWKQ